MSECQLTQLQHQIQSVSLDNQQLQSTIESLHNHNTDKKNELEQYKLDHNLSYIDSLSIDHGISSRQTQHSNKLQSIIKSQSIQIETLQAELNKCKQKNFASFAQHVLPPQSKYKPDHNKKSINRLGYVSLEFDG